MNKKIYLCIALLSLIITACVALSMPLRKGASEAELTNHSIDLKSQNDFHLLLQTGDGYLAKSQFSLAETKYLEALRSSEGTSLEGVTRSALMRLYEAMGDYDKALNMLDWLLNNMDPHVPQYQIYLTLKKEYLSKL